MGTIDEAITLRVNNNKQSQRDALESGPEAIVTCFITRLHTRGKRIFRQNRQFSHSCALVDSRARRSRNAAAHLHRRRRRRSRRHAGPSD